MRIAYFGTSEFAVPALQALAPHVALVVTQPDRPSGRKMLLQPSPVKIAAAELDLPVLSPLKARQPEFIELIERERFDVMVVAAYGQILSKRLLEATLRGGINLHGSLLPALRGAAPIQRALMNGDTETGVTLMQMDEGMDTGDIIDVSRLTIDPDEVYGELHQRLAVVAADLVEAWIERIERGEYPRVAQNSALASHAPKIEKSDAELRFIEDSEAAYNRFRGVTPSPGAWTTLMGQPMKVLRARRTAALAPPGTLVDPDTMEVAFAGGSLQFLEVAPAGKKRMSGKDCCNGMRLKAGDRLESQ